jgi:hypothetical protein
MNLLWIAMLTALVLAEQLVPRGHLLGWIAGLLMIGWGGWLVFLAVYGSQMCVCRQSHNGLAEQTDGFAELHLASS